MISHRPAALGAQTQTVIHSDEKVANVITNAWLHHWRGWASPSSLVLPSVGLKEALNYWKRKKVYTQHHLFRSNTQLTLRKSFMSSDLGSHVKGWKAWLVKASSRGYIIAFPLLSWFESGSAINYCLYNSRTQFFFYDTIWNSICSHHSLNKH